MKKVNIISFSVLLLMIFVMSCGAIGVNNNEAQVFGKAPSYEVLIEGQVGGFEKPQIHVIKEEGALKEVYEQINKTSTPKYDVPTVNFKRETVVAVFMGARNTGGYRVSVTAIKKQKKKLVVRVLEEEPGAKDMVTTVLTQPYCIVKIDDADREIIFEKE